MKISVALLILLLAVAWTGSQGLSFLSSKANCCSKLSRGKIPDSMIQSYQYTSPTCTHKAVFVKLQKVTVCVDPKQKWFQEYLRKQKQLKSTSK
ncbi:CCL8 protein, partial [Peucedramus taeniatus]|nr:CCL8 protein [Peucedramus taeniatus]